MRDILWGAALAVVVMLLIRGLRSPGARPGGPYPDPPQDAWFQSSVIEPSQRSPVIVKFGAEWCGPCRAMEPQLDKVAAAHPGKLEIVRLDTSEHRGIADHFCVSAIPHTYVVSGGKIVDDRIGYLSAGELADLVKPWLR